MPDTVAAYCLYPVADPRPVLESVVTSLDRDGDAVEPLEPRERFGVLECHLSVDAPPDAMAVGLEAVPADGRSHATPAVPALEFTVGADGFAYGERGLTAGALVDVTWLTVFTPPFVDAYGKHVLRTAPVWRREEFEDGALALVSTPDPSDPNDVDHDGLRKHLGVARHGPGT